MHKYTCEPHMHTTVGISGTGEYGLRNSRGEKHARGREIVKKDCSADRRKKATRNGGVTKKGMCEQ